MYSHHCQSTGHDINRYRPIDWGRLVRYYRPKDPYIMVPKSVPIEYDIMYVGVLVLETNIFWILDIG
jgi:hypothetical protein